MRNPKFYTEKELITHTRACSEWMASGNSLKSDAQEQDIIFRTLQNWVAKHRKESAETTRSSKSLGRVPRIENRQSETTRTSSLKVSLGALSIELPAGNNEHDLRRVLRALKEVL